MFTFSIQHGYASFEDAAQVEEVTEPYWILNPVMLLGFLILRKKCMIYSQKEDILLVFRFHVLKSA
ncbi:MAG: hypothetical protein D3924_17070 [Candidatus Electrothrix sp. AR4]|nr:hypothetical protein [Candidatus Electrothrix sp. AR4]